MVLIVGINNVNYGYPKIHLKNDLTMLVVSKPNGTDNLIRQLKCALEVKLSNF